MFKGRITDLIKAPTEGRADWEGRNDRPATPQIVDLKTGKHAAAEMRAKLAKGAR